MFKSPGDIAFTLFGLDVRWYGVMMSLAMLTGILVILLIRRKYFKDISVDIICDISFLLIFAGLVSARLYYVIMDYSYFFRHPEEIPAIWNGGISIQGAIIGGIIFGLFYTKSMKISFLRYADLFSFGIITGQAIGRWGNFFNSEAFGLPTNLPWKLFIPFASRPLEYRNYEFFHPTFLYESLLNICIFIILYLVLKKFTNRHDGFIFFLYIILYSLVRIIVESLRIDSVLNIGYFHIAHITSVLFILAASIGIYYVQKNKKTTD